MSSMSQPAHAATPPLAGAQPPGSPTHRNRLTITHTLLWTTATGIALTYFQAQKPPPLGFASIIVGPGTTLEIERAKLQQKFSRQLHFRYAVGLVFAPVYGAALAGGLLAIGRLATRRFGFPVQPGHWLLLVIANMFLWMVAHPLLRRLPGSPDVADFVGVIWMTSVLVAVTVIVREPLRWCCVFGLASAGFLLLTASVLAYILLPPSIELSPLFLLGIGAIVAVPFAALLCLALDIADCSRRYDYLHWAGVATLLGVALQYFVLWGVSR
jgi:hypothetical protein